ncbi:MAG: class I SAM-dependent methyltransferase [bacterium]
MRANQQTPLTASLAVPSFNQNENFRAFYHSVAARYPEESIVYQTLRGKLREKFVLGFLRRFHGRLLDLGCNTGHYLSCYQNGASFGVDIAYPALKRARENQVKAHFIQGDAQNLALRNGSFDAILCSEVLEHVPFPEKVFSECLRILKPGGTFLVSTPNYKRKKPTWSKVGRMRNYGIQGVKGEYYFHTAFRPEELKAMAERAGLLVHDYGTFEKEVKYATRVPVLLFYALHFLNKLVFKSARVDDFNEAMLEKCSYYIYEIVSFLRLNRFFASLVREGVRSYLLVKKLPSSH